MFASVQKLLGSIVLRIGFASKRAVRPPYVCRAVDGWIFEQLGNNADRSTPMLLRTQARGGATRFLEEIYYNSEPRLGQNGRAVFLDLVKRAEWSQLEFLVDARNQVVSSIDRKNPTKLPELCFSGFGFLAMLYWCVGHNCESDPPWFSESKYAKSYKKIGKAVFNTLGGSLIEAAVEAIDLADIFADVATSVVELSTEERVDKAFSKLSRSNLPIGNGEAAEIRKKLKRGEHITESELTGALTDEFLRGLQSLSEENGEINIMFAYDAVDILETELEYLEVATFFDSFEKLMCGLQLKKGVHQLAASRNSADLVSEKLAENGWRKVDLPPISRTDVRRRIALDEEHYGVEIARLILGQDEAFDDDPVDLRAYADTWQRYEKGVLDETS